MLTAHRCSRLLICHGRVWGSCWAHVGLMLDSCWTHLGSCWAHAGLMLDSSGLMLDSCWTHLGSCWAHAGLMLDSCWAHPAGWCICLFASPRRRTPPAARPPMLLADAQRWAHVGLMLDSCWTHLGSCWAHAGLMFHSSGLILPAACLPARVGGPRPQPARRCSSAAPLMLIHRPAEGSWPAGAPLMLIWLTCWLRRPLQAPGDCPPANAHPAPLMLIRLR